MTAQPATSAYGPTVWSVLSRRLAPWLDPVLGVLATAAALVSLLGTDPATLDPRLDPPNALAVVATTVAGLSLVWRRSRPTASYVVYVTACLVVSLSGHYVGVLSVFLLVALYSLATHAPRRTGVIGLAATVAVFVVLALLDVPDLGTSDLLQAVVAKTFREDLYYRLNVIHMTVPPLRDRPEDIPSLLDHFVSTFASEYATPRLTFTPEARALLSRYHFPGNVRELKNLVERLTVRHGTDRAVGVEDLPQEVRHNVTPAPAPGAAAQNPAETLFRQLVEERQSFWTLVYGPFMSRDLTRDTLRTLVSLGLQRTGGSYRDLLELFHMAPGDYKRFLNFLRKHQCHMPFQQFRGPGVPDPSGGPNGRPSGPVTV